MGNGRNRLKYRHEQRADEDFVRGPVRKDPRTVPVLDALSAHHEDEVLPSRIPVHHQGKATPPRAVEALGGGVSFNDVSRLQGLDNRLQSWRERSTAECPFAEAVGADETLFSTNGSTTSVHTAMHAVVGSEDKLAIARNAHLSAVTGLMLTGAMPVWVEPSYDDDAKIAHGVTPSGLAAALDDHPDVRAAMVKTPTFYGVSSDVAALADMCHPPRHPAHRRRRLGSCLFVPPGPPALRPRKRRRHRYRKCAQDHRRPRPDVAHRGGHGSSYVPPAPKTTELLTEQVVSPRDAFFVPATSIELGQGVDRIAAEYVTPYAPGMPVLVPGERVSADIVDYLDAVAAAGVISAGATDPSLRRLRVVA